MFPSLIPIACSVCFGDPSSSLTKGALMGVVFLLGVIVFVLGAILYTAIQWSKRAKLLGRSV